MNHSLVSQEQDHRTWSILKLFYQAVITFRQQYDQYEEKVLAYARESGIHREALRLNSAELAGLLDFKNLERLRDGWIHELKDLCHVVFRSQDRTDPLDRYISDIFHEISILKEEHYNVKTYAPLYERDAAKIELQYILDEAHTIFPQKLRHILYLFGKAQERMEQHLPSFRFLPIVIRSLYLHRNDFVREAYPGGLREFYGLMYPGGPLEGFFQVGLSFYHSGFFPEALEAFAMALAEHGEAVRRSRRSRGPAVAERRNGGGAQSPRPPAAGSLLLAERRLLLRSLRAKVRRLSRRGDGARHTAPRAEHLSALPIPQDLRTRSASSIVT
jgi:hypothetical protein